MSLDRFQLTGMCAIVTGGSKGLGRSMAKALSAAGADVVVTSRHADEAKAAAAEIADSGRRALGLAADTGDRAALLDMVRHAESAFGKVDILVNNAGTGQIKPALEVTEDDWEPQLRTNLKGCFLCAQAVAPGMMTRRYGRIINLGSIFSGVGTAGLAPYIASKHGVLGLTRALALEWARSGITVNCLCPAFFATDLNRPIHSDEAAYEQVAARTPLGRWGESQELDGPIVFLASPASSYVTGTAVYVDGGWTAQ